MEKNYLELVCPAPSAMFDLYSAQNCPYELVPKPDSLVKVKFKVLWDTAISSVFHLQRFVINNFYKNYSKNG